MSLLLDVLFAAHARSTHHKLALDALEHLTHPTTEAWRTTFLTHYARYLAGAKDPDDRFKDFRNHVLHVRQGNWGGAIASARKWYIQAVEEFRRRNWSDGVYAAGVLSHYFTDPVQPFHTHQSEAENNIHRAFEWSTTKSYEELRNLLDQRFGYPIIELGTDELWLDDLIERGARLSNKFYESLIDHYDFYRGSRNPPEGFDDFCRVSLSRLIGWAIIGYARVLDRLFEEADVIPPAQGLTMASFFATLEMPIQWITKKIEDSRERTLIEQMYAEFQSTGKVDEFLPADDRTIRDLIAARDQKRTSSRTPNPPSNPSTSIPKESPPERVQKNPVPDPVRTPEPAVVNETPLRKPQPSPIVTGNSIVSEPAVVRLASPSGQPVPAKLFETPQKPFRPEIPLAPAAIVKPISEEHGEGEANSTPEDHKLYDEVATEISNSAPSHQAVIPETEPEMKPKADTPATVVLEKPNIPVLLPLDFEIPTETVPTPHVRFEQTTLEETGLPRLQRAIPDVVSTVTPIIDAGFDETSPDLTRLDPPHGGVDLPSLDAIGETIPEIDHTDDDEDQPSESRDESLNHTIEDSPEQQELEEDHQPHHLEESPSAERSPRDERTPRYYLELDSQIVDAPSIGPKTAKRLKGCRIRTVNDFLEANPQELAAALRASHITEQVLRDWQDQARLVCGIPELRGHDAQLLVACNIRTPQAVADSEESSLARRIDRFSKSPAGQRILRNGASPDEEEVTEWIENARQGRGIQES